MCRKATVVCSNRHTLVYLFKCTVYYSSSCCTYLKKQIYTQKKATAVHIRNHTYTHSTERLPVQCRTHIFWISEQVRWLLISRSIWFSTLPVVLFDVRAWRVIMRLIKWDCDAKYALWGESDCSACVCMGSNLGCVGERTRTQVYCCVVHYEEKQTYIHNRTCLQAEIFESQNMSTVCCFPALFDILKNHVMFATLRVEY